MMLYGGERFPLPGNKLWRKYNHLRMFIHQLILKLNQTCMTNYSIMDTSIMLLVRCEIQHSWPVYDISLLYATSYIKNVAICNQVKKQKLFLHLVPGTDLRITRTHTRERQCVTTAVAHTSFAVSNPYIWSQHRKKCTSFI